MRPTPWLLAEPHRAQAPGYESGYGDAFGAFRIPYPQTGATLLCLAVDGRISQKDFGDEFAWDHVSVSTKGRTPNWLEMSAVKSLFWGEDETVMQLHVPAAEHIDLHPHTLHLWRPLLAPIPRPPQGAV